MAAQAAGAAPSPAADPAILVVTGRALAAPPGAAAYDSVTIERERLGESASGRLEDSLRDVAGFQQFRRTNSSAANPTSQGATLRSLGGNAASRVLILLDGAPVADPFAGFIPFSALAPERLALARVVRGSGAGAFGAGAVAGIIELESAGADALDPVYARAFYGERNASELAAGVAPTIGRGFVTADARWDRGDGYRIVPAGQRGSIDIAAGYSSVSANLRGVAPLGAESELQARVLLFRDTRIRGLPDTRNSSEGVDAVLRYVTRAPWAVDALAFYQARNFTSGFVAVDSARTRVTPTLDQYRTPATGAGGKLELRPPLGRHQVLRLGADARYAGGRTNERFRYQAGNFTRLRRAGGASLVAGLFVEGDWTHGPLTLTGGARLDRWALTGGALIERDIASGAPTQSLAYRDRRGWEPTVRGGVRLALDPRLAVRAAGYTGFRLPTLNELYRPFRVGADATAANAALGNELLRGGEIGLDWRPLPAVALQATGFLNQLRHAVGNVTLGQGPGVFPQVGFVAAGGAFRQRLNLDAIRAAGLELTATATWRGLRFDTSYAYSDARVRGSGAAAALDGLQPAQTPRHQLSATLGWRSARNGNVSLTLRHVSAQFDDDLQARRLPGATTFDAYAALPLGAGLRLIGRAENVTNQRVVSGLSSTGLQDLAAPRTLWIGLSYAPGRRGGN